MKNLVMKMFRTVFTVIITTILATHVVNLVCEFIPVIHGELATVIGLILGTAAFVLCLIPITKLMGLIWRIEG